VETLFAFYK